ncbi:hypothetical protein [Aggregatilinea lenta]|uniref:hypothetical protein n=1 Tax=Aggregatilinea lenta TaxID=913108 RepID=UPI000E5A6B7A|nr:hypothetical protein [Aggregatilinea lenta]
MNWSDVHQILTLVSWLLVAAFIFILSLIARFYEQMASQRTYYQLFAVPLVVFGAAALRTIVDGKVAGDGWLDLLLLVGGVCFAVLAHHTYRLMTSGR